MSEDSYQDSSARRKRVQRLKKIIIVTLIISILIPYVACIVLFVEVHGLNRKLDDMSNRLEELTGIYTEQQEQLRQWSESAAVEAQGAAVAGREETSENVTDGPVAGESALGAEVVPQDEPLHKVYLTFDDGPSKYTEDILEILDRYQVKATFFVVGKDDAGYEENLRSIVSGEHTLGLHSYSHKYDEIYGSVEAFSEDFMRLQDYVYEVTGVKSTIYRFPGGSSNTVSELNMQEFADYLESQGVEYYDWNISSGDAGNKLLDAQTIVDNCISDVANYQTSIILLHDSGDKPTTVEALPLIIENILAMEDTVILPITEDTKPIQHIDTKRNE